MFFASQCPLQIAIQLDTTAQDYLLAAEGLD
jgi:hypothetical protein